ncbi:MAG: zinc ribbon domain-containing protein [Planctomycetes bacterium]|jgi:putative FmdB family regulatory protein|nr:zinc ribbon domain-containing protein [Planctomycetota bacterium]
MPIYEFACDACRSVVQVFFRSAGAVIPKCPRCGAKGLRRLLSGFAVGGRARRGKGPDVSPAVGGEPDPTKVEAALSRLEGEMGDLDEEDPRQMGRLLRRVMEETGTGLGEGVEEALRRLEAGEDPEKIEEELGDVLGEGGEGAGPGADGDYSYDDHLYEG